MRSLIRPIKNKKAEALIESIISILVFSILMLAISTMLVASLRITSHATANAEELQNKINEASTEDYVGTSASIKFKLEYPTGSVVIPDVVTQSVTYTDEKNIVVFKPN